jgi:hypothetical protein
VSTSRILLAAACAALVAAACEPASITEARNQLARGDVRFVEYVIPVSRDTLTVLEIFEDFVDADPITLADNLLAVATDAQLFTVGTGAEVGAISGILDPAVLNFVTEQWREVTTTSLNLGEFDSAARDATINSALAALDVSNSADAPLTLTDFVLGVVQLDGSGLPLRDIGGNLLYEEDAGTPILVLVADPGGTTWDIGRTTTRVDTLAASALVDRLVDLALEGTRVALVGAGTVSVGDNTVGTVLGTDQLLITITPIIGLDFTIPQTGVSFDSTTVQDGLDLELKEIEDIEDLVDSAGVTLEVENGTPFGVEASIAIVEGSFAGDVFAAPGAVLVDPVAVGPGTVDANGRVTQSVVERDSVTLAGDEIRPFMGLQFTAGIRVRLLPTASGRGAFSSTDRVVVQSAARVLVRSGGGQ